MINNLLISCIELRTEESIDVFPYTHLRRVEKYVIKLDGVIGEINVKFINVLNGIIKKLYSQKAVYTEDAKKLSRYQLIKVLYLVIAITIQYSNYWDKDFLMLSDTC